MTSWLPKYLIGNWDSAISGNAGRRNGIDAEEGFRRHLHGVEEGLVRMPKAVDTKKFDLKAFPGGNSTDDNILHTFLALRLMAAPV
ncbi:MAG: hypothetical protein U0236_14360 [Nitrospira sp.]